MGSTGILRVGEGIPGLSHWRPDVGLERVGEEDNVVDVLRYSRDDRSNICCYEGICRWGTARVR